MQDCSLGVEVRRMWSEQELVRSFGGRMSPGTPDGMFETWDGRLTCVQVVRVPLVREADTSAMQHTLTQTILAKVVKSQTWLRFVHVMPHDFIIYCWLPYRIPDEVSQHVDVLMSNLRKLDARFSVRLRLPAEPDAIFPALLARIPFEPPFNIKASSSLVWVCPARLRLFASNYEERLRLRSRSLSETWPFKDRSSELSEIFKEFFWFFVSPRPSMQHPETLNPFEQERRQTCRHSWRATTKTKTMMTSASGTSLGIGLRTRGRC